MKRSKRDKVDSLIDHLWQHGYLTLSRKYGKYLPEPKPIGNYEIDAIARYKKKIALGLAITKDDLDNPNFLSKLEFLAKAKAKFGNAKVTLFLGVPSNMILKVEMLVNSLDEEIRNMIKIAPLPESSE